MDKFKQKITRCFWRPPLIIPRPLGARVGQWQLLADTTPMSMMLEGNRIAKGAPAIAVPRGRL